MCRLAGVQGLRGGVLRRSGWGCRFSACSLGASFFMEAQVMLAVSNQAPCCVGKVRTACALPRLWAGWRHVRLTGVVCRPPHGSSVDLVTSLVAAGRSVLQRREKYVCCVSRADAALCAGCTQVVTHLCQLPCWATAWVCKGCCEHGTARAIATRQPLQLASRQIVVVVYAQ